MLNSDKEMNREKWARYVEAQEGSGLPQKKWCEANQVKYHNFRYWRQRLNKENIQHVEKDACEMPECNEPFEFARVLIQPVETAGDRDVAATIMSSIHLEIRGMVLDIPSTYDETFLLRLIRTLTRL